jgi:two-component system response regulator HydG
MNKPLAGFTPEALELVKSYDWPGNIRELKNAIERAVVVAKGNQITPDELPIPRGAKTIPESQSLESMEKAHIKNILEQMGWNISKAAEVLKIDRVTLYNKIEKYGLRK